ncbi:MAG TPA: nitrite reductase large subunit NirB [Polyangia bacterium]|nr:nitrite reductase large subunit NirB [Polyangia bacterium]
MVGHHAIERLIEADHARAHSIVVFGEEPYAAYDRVHLTARFADKSAAELSLLTPGRYEAAGVELILGDRITTIDRAAKTVTSASGRVVAYDRLIFATGSAPFVPPVAGRDALGCFVYRTLDDVAAIADYASRSRVGVVIGGGLLGLEAADALRRAGLVAHVVEVAPRLMALQLDEVGGALLRTRVEALGVVVHTGAQTTAIESDDGRVARLRFADGSALDTDMVVFSAGIRPRDELARAAGLALGARGGIVVDEQCRTSDRDIFAIGECALAAGRIHGLVAPGYQMARVAVDAIVNGDGGDARFTGADASTKLKLLDVDVASFGEPLNVAAATPMVTYFDAIKGIYKKLVLSADKRRLVGGILVGDAAAYASLVQLYQSGAVVPPALEDLILPPRADAPAGRGVDALPATATICSCLNVTKGAICDAIGAQKLSSVAAVKSCTSAGTGCGSCVPLVGELLRKELARAGVGLSDHLCEHFARSRQELFHLLRLHRIKSFDALIAAHGNGSGCEICKPAVASMLASTWNEHVLDRKHRPLQDTNDRFLANIQRDGTYSVVPRVPGGEITPEKLIVLGQVAQKYELYTKITGGQRIDLFGARVEQLPAIWSELIAAGFESGHAYGKALRTVKSCVGSTWCRYGVQDSVSFAIALENRYKGLRSPHKLKSAVSGCARECAEAQSKDFGLIATEKGYNLHLCGNGGMKPQHAPLFATDLDEATAVRYLDRFLMFYIRTADRLQRTASWLNSLDGGIDYLKQVIIEDSLGICAELEAEMEALVGSYQCEWKATLADPEKLTQFRSFVNVAAPDPSIVFVRQRAQSRPADWDEKAAALDALDEAG